MKSTNAPSRPALPPTLTDVHEAARRIAPYVSQTPLLQSRSLSEKLGIDLRFKCENLQRAGSFKIRGAVNALLQLTDEQRNRGVVAFSSGNHAQGVALAARLLGIRATIVMPEGAVASKVEATRRYGAEVVQAGVTQVTRDDVAREISERTGASIIPPFNDARIIAGAGTVGQEIVAEWPGVRNLIVPVGGGGLLSGTALTASAPDSSVKVFGVEPRAGNDVQQSFQKGEIVQIAPPDTVADGARTTAVGAINFEIIKRLVSDIVSVTDKDLLASLWLTMYRTKLLIEPTGCLGLAALMNGELEVEGPTAVVLSGGNIDLQILKTLQ